MSIIYQLKICMSIVFQFYVNILSTPWIGAVRTEIESSRVQNVYTEKGFKNRISHTYSVTILGL